MERKKAEVQRAQYNTDKKAFANKIQQLEDTLNIREHKIE
jgi:hypothetical protein